MSAVRSGRADIPRLKGEYVGLRPIVGADYDLIFAWETSPEALLVYRHRGDTVAPEQFAERLWSGVVAQFMIYALRDSMSLGLCAAYGADFRNGHIQIASLLAPEYRDRGWPLEGVVLFIEYLFHAYPVGKIYAEALEINAKTFGHGISAAFDLEGRLVGHDYIGGRHVDRLLFALHRDRYFEWRNETSVLAKLLGDD